MHDFLSMNQHLEPSEARYLSHHALLSHQRVWVRDAGSRVRSAEMCVAAERKHLDGVGSQVFGKGDDERGEASVENGVIVAADGVEGDKVNEGQV